MIEKSLVKDMKSKVALLSNQSYSVAVRRPRMSRNF